MLNKIDDSIEKLAADKSKDNTLKNTAISGAIGGSVGGLVSHAVKKVNDHFNKDRIDSITSTVKDSKNYANEASNRLDESIAKAKSSKDKALKEFKQRHSYWKNPKNENLSRSEARQKISRGLFESKINKRSVKGDIEQRDLARKGIIVRKKVLSDLKDRIKAIDSKNIFIKKKYMIPAAALASAGSYLAFKKHDSNIKK